jgi:hypothetical protein
MNGRDETLAVGSEKRVVRKELRKTVVAAEKKRRLREVGGLPIDINQGRRTSPTGSWTRAGRGGADLETLGFVHSRRGRANLVCNACGSQVRGRCGWWASRGQPCFSTCSLSLTNRVFFPAAAATPPQFRQ